MKQHDDGIGYLLDKLKEQRQIHIAHMATGKSKDYAEYKQLCGFVQGLDFAEQIVRDLAAKLESDDDE